MKHSKAMAAHISEHADGLRDIVANIEKSVATTQNHYGDYLSILTMTKNEKSRTIFAHALIEAGASKAGVGAAMRIF